jgi:hypothetical protein
VLFQGHTVYGISELALSATGLQATVEDCATAAKSHDARDKFFQSFVGEFGMCSSKALRSELPSLEVYFCIMSFPAKVYCFLLALSSSGSARICGIHCK